MVTYRRKRGSDVWHWCTNCEDWPVTNYAEQDLPVGMRPSTGELDDDCLAREKRGECTTKS